jgi:hypothetical protein
VVAWELATAAVPFHGLPPLRIAFAVALEGMRLPVPAAAPRTFLRLMARCWAEDPTRRPEFRAIVDELSDIHALAAAAAAERGTPSIASNSGTGSGAGSGAGELSASPASQPPPPAEEAQATAAGEDVHWTLEQLSSRGGSATFD